MKKSGIITGVLLSITIILVVTIVLWYKEIYIKNYNATLRTKQKVPWGVQSINAPALWSDVTGKGVKVAVLDSGINKHPDLGGNIKEGYNAINPSEFPIDDYGHGTIVCGVIAAQKNRFGIVGVAPEAELYPVKVLDSYGEGDILDVVNGIDWCIKNKIQIINMSFAIENDNDLLRSSVKRAIDAGIIVVASALNSYKGNAGFPASYDKVISVTAVDERLKICKTAPKGKVDFSAPGVDVLSIADDDGYEEFTGTSIAAPHITGVIALIFQDPKKFGLFGSKTEIQSDVYKLLKHLSKDLGQAGKDKVFGEGFVSFQNIKTK